MVDKQRQMMINHNKRNIINISETTVEDEGSCASSYKADDEDNERIDHKELEFILNQKIVDHKFPSCKTKMWSGGGQLSRTRSKSQEIYKKDSFALPFDDAFGSYENSSAKNISQSVQFDPDDEYGMTVGELANIKRNFTMLNKNLDNENEQYVER